MATAENSSEIQRLYEIATALDNDIDKIAVDPTKYEAMYDEILQGSKGAQKTKMLAAQFIPKYLKHFPKFTEKSINYLIDLCEEEDVPTRVNAIRALPIITKITPESLPKLADILGQLLQAELQVELDKVKQALVSLLQQDLKGTLPALFNLTLSEDEDLRVKVIAFIFEKVLPLRDEINKTEDLQRSVAENVKKVLPHVVSAKEFKLFTDLLYSLKIYAKGAAAGELLDLLADINADFIATDESHVAKLATCLHSATDFLQRGASSEKFTALLALKVLPTFEQIKEQTQVELIQQLTETAGHFTANDAKTLLPPLYELVLSQLPPPPPAGSEGQAKINFSITESALYIFHVLASKAPGSLRGLCGINVITGQPSSMSTELAVEKKKDLDARLKHLEESTKKYILQMEGARKTLQKAITPEEVQRKNIINIALKTTHNVLQLAQNLLKSNPNFGAAITKMELARKDNKAKRPQPGKSVPAKATPAPTTTTTTATATSTNKEDKATVRPAFGNVYVPPSRQPGGGGAKKRTTTDSTAQQEQPEPLSLKKHKGRGSSKFQQ